MAGAQFLGLGREPEEGIDLALREQVERLDFGINNPLKVFFGVEPHLGCHQLQQRGRACLQSDLLSLQFSDAAEAFAGEQLVAAGMHTGKDRDRRPVIDRLDVVDREGDREIDPAIGEHLRQLPSRGFDIGDFLEALGAQQLLGGILRRGRADEGALEQAHGSRFERPFCRKHSRRVEQAHGAGP
jgi:hypothetical protein